MIKNKDAPMTYCLKAVTEDSLLVEKYINIISITVCTVLISLIKSEEAKYFIGDNLSQ